MPSICKINNSPVAKVTEPVEVIKAAGLNLKKMKVRLKGKIHPELESIGLKAGDEIEVYKDTTSEVGCCHFTKYVEKRIYDCSIWPENYEIIEPLKS